MVVLVLGPDGATHDACLAVAALDHEVHGYTPGSVPAGLLVRSCVDVVVLDLASRQDAFRLLRRLGSSDEKPPVVCIADGHGVGGAADALRLGALDIIGRPIQSASLSAALDNAREIAARTDDIEEPSADSTAEGLFGPSHAMRAVLGLARRAATLRCPVLIVGEAGAGRDVVARAVHAASGRGPDRFVKVCCLSVSETDLREALSAPPEATIYLDDVEELSPALYGLLDAHLRSPADGPRVIACAQPRLWDWIDRGIVSRAIINALSLLHID